MVRQIFSATALALCLASSPLYAADPVCHPVDLSKLQDPTLIKKAMAQMEVSRFKDELNQNRKLISQYQDLIFNQDKDPFTGDSCGAPIIVAFADPFCGHCRHLHDDVLKGLPMGADTKGWKVVFKDMAIMGPDSVMGVKAMLAAQLQGKYLEMQDKVYHQPRPMTQEVADNFAKDLGLDVAKFKKDMDGPEVKAQMKAVSDLAGTLGIDGTPTTIVGDSLVPGAMSLEDFKALVVLSMQANSSPEVHKKG